MKIFLLVDLYEQTRFYHRRTRETERGVPLYQYLRK